MKEGIGENLFVMLKITNNSYLLHQYLCDDFSKFIVKKYRDFDYLAFLFPFPLNPNPITILKSINHHSTSVLKNVQQYRVFCCMSTINLIYDFTIIRLIVFTDEQLLNTKLILSKNTQVFMYT